MKARNLISVRRRHDPESGQATVEFALILFPLLILVTGIIWFGIGLNYWLDMNRISNQGARWAAVNCARSASTPPTFNPCTPSLKTTLEQQAITAGLANSVCVDIAFPSGSSERGDPVRIRVRSPFTFVPILGIGTITLNAQTEMRIEQKASAFSATAACP